MSAIAVAAALWLAAGISQPPRLADPAPGVFLVAKPTIGAGPFHHSVVLLLAHGAEGTLGVIINRETEIPIEEVLPDVEVKDSGSHSLRFGGPVALDGLLFLFRSDEPPDEAQNVMGNVFYAGSRKMLERLLKEEGSDRLKLFLGHAGWAPGQLRSEIARGDWDLVRADAFTVFQKSPDMIWPELSKWTGTVVAFASQRR